MDLIIVDFAMDLILVIDIKDIIFEMVENDAENNFEKRDFLNYLREMSI